ncbi:MAG TPA: hypothetical protein PJ984_00700 [Candidatus Saccharibacteria bacterium]|jgi:hypothetical protein|nr:hypothetical protein [Patescibacteria group bacterium]HMS30898.1 hypothetical protein [Candidatus Saccharibacteria bacterium]
MGRYEQAPQPRFADEEPDFGYAGSETYMDDRWSDAPMTDDEIFDRQNPSEAQRIEDMSAGNVGLGDPKQLNREIRKNGGQG